jgi:transposase
LPEIKKHRPEFAQIHSQVIQGSLKRRDSAFDGFFRRVKEGQKPDYPRFRSSFRYDSFRYPQTGFSLKRDKLHLPKIGKVKLHLSRPIEGDRFFNHPSHKPLPREGLPLKRSPARLQKSPALRIVVATFGSSALSLRV